MPSAAQVPSIVDVLFNQRIRAAVKRWSPMARVPRNIGASVRARLLDRARAAITDFQILLTRYALEQLLYRLSVSDLRERASEFPQQVGRRSFGSAAPCRLQW
jgi:hypothetical protein